jgi:DNA-binding transcriptional regulator PaaX
MATKFKGIKTAAEYRRGELSRDILRLVGAGIALSGIAFAAPNTLQLIDYFDPRGRDERNRIWKTIKYLEQKNRIVIERRQGRDIVTLTEHGRLILSEDAVAELAVRTPRRWDRKWRLVMFDFPARYERVRAPFRSKLQDLGFKLYQRSVFIFPYECHEEVHTVAQWYGVDDFIRYIVASEIHDTREFAKQFDLL